MKFDDHEIWGAPARAPEPAGDAATPSGAAAVPAPDSPGRLYRSAGSDAHPEAILALPGPRRHTAAHPIEASAWAQPSSEPGKAPISINSRIPRPAPIEDAAIAEVLGGPAVAEPGSGFTSWFKRPAAAEAASEDVTPRPSTSAPLTAAAADISGALLGIPMTARAFAASVFVVTTLVALVDAVLRDALGAPTGIALVVATALCTWRIEPGSRWAAWVLPPYLLAGTILLAGQFTDAAPGFSPLGQMALIVVWMISLAPWLAVATVIGAALSALRKRA